MTHKTTIILLLASTLAISCADDGSWTDEPTPRAPSTTLELLQKGVEFSFLPSQSSIAIEVSWGSQTTQSSELALGGGQILLSADDLGIVEIASFEIQIDDLHIAHPALPADIQLTDISLRLPEPQRGEVNDWSDDRESGRVFLQSDMTLDWSLVKDDQAVPLGAQGLVAIPMQLDLERGKQGVLVRLRVDGDGPFWSWLDSVELSDLQLDLRADELGPID